MSIDTTEKHLTTPYATSEIVLGALADVRVLMDDVAHNLADGHLQEAKNGITDSVRCLEAVKAILDLTRTPRRGGWADRVSKGL